jgi:transcriptional regulator with XRE-family HTH domain
MSEKLLALVAEIAAEMDRQGITRNALAVKAGVPAATVTRILSGERPDPQLSTLVRLAEVLGKRVTLVGSDSPPEPPKRGRPRGKGK